MSQHEKATYLASALWPGLTATAISMQLKMDGADSFGEEIRNHKELSFLVQQSWMALAKSNGEEIGLTGWSEAMQLDSSSRSTVAIAGRGSEKAETERSCSDVATGPGTGAREDELRFSTSFEVRKD